MTDKDTIIDRIIDLLSDCVNTGLEEEKVNNLHQVQELVIHNDLLDNFLDEIVGFQNDRSVEVRKFVIGFIAASCLKDPEYFTKLIINLNFLLNDPNPNVVKKTIQTATKLYKKFFIWMNKSKKNELIESAFEVWNQMKIQIIEMFDSTENDGIRTQCTKFMEMLVILQTRKDKWTVPEDDFDLDQIQVKSFFTLEQLEDEAKQVFESLIIFHGSPHISSVNLMATMQSLVLISKTRSSYFLEKVLQALESLNANLPPTLAKSQVSSVRKQLKLQLQILLKHPAAVLNSNYQLQITQLLNDLGATQADIHKCLQEVRKRGIKIEQACPEPKRIKLESDVKNIPKTHENISQQHSIENKVFDSNMFKITKNDALTAVDITAESLVSKLSVTENACNLVLLSLLSLPETIPAHFIASYTPMGSGGTSAQIKNLSRLLATQFTAAGIGKGIQEMVCKFEKTVFNSEEVDEKSEQHLKIAALVSRGIAQEINKQESLKTKTLNNKLKLMPTGKIVNVSKAMKQLNFAEITKEPTEEFKFQMVYDSVNRILNDEDKLSFTSKQNQTRIKILSHLATKYHRKNLEIFILIKDYAFKDLRSKLSILTSIVAEEFESFKKDETQIIYLNECLDLFLKDFIHKVDHKERDHFLPKFFSELPYLTDDALNNLKDYILLGETSTIENGFNIAKTLIENIGSFRFKILDIILDFCNNSQPNIRNFATTFIKKLHENNDDKFKESIENFVFQMLQKLLETNQNCPNMDEESIKLCLIPYLNLLPSNHKLIHNLATIYVSMNPNIKRVILRSLETPVKGMGMNSPELLLLVENCPKGAETLVTRIIHVLTDKQPPSTELVSRVRDLYQKRVPDVRFLIPVLNGLSKKEIIDALPELIMLNPNVVKEVFNRLLNDGGSNFQSPLTPSELLIALHNIDPNKCDMKTTIKATGLCFAEKNIYTAEVLAVVMQLLMEQNPLPTLLMRTVIQSVSLYPQLIGFVMNILQRLILKQVWKQKKVWEGFIKCCQRTKPKSFQVLLQLPAPQLQTVFASSPDFKFELQEYVESFNDTQKKHIPQSILDAIFSNELNTNLIDDLNQQAEENLNQQIKENKEIDNNESKNNSSLEKFSLSDTNQNETKKNDLNMDVDESIIKEKNEGSILDLDERKDSLSAENDSLSIITEKDTLKEDENLTKMDLDEKSSV